MIPPIWGSLFMGDVYADMNYTLSVTVGVNTDIVTIKKGSWWANPCVFYLWLNSYLINSGSIIFYVKPDNYRDNLAIAFTVDRTIVWTAGTGTLKAEIGMPTDGVYGTGPYCDILGWWTTFPVRTYERGTTVLDGCSTRAHSGKTYSVTGETQGTRKLQVSFDRRYDKDLTNVDRYEYQSWRNLWRYRWNQGRSVSFWLNLPPFLYQFDQDVNAWGYVSTLTWGDAPGKLGKFEQLISVPENKVWRPNRLIETREFMDTEESAATFYLRPKKTRSNPGVTDLYWIAP